MSTSAIERDRAAWERLAATLKPQGQAFIAGRSVPARDGRVFSDVSPIDGQRICEGARCGAAEVDAAATPARATFESGSWPPLDPKHPNPILRPISALIP